MRIVQILIAIVVGSISNQILLDESGSNPRFHALILIHRKYSCAMPPEFLTQFECSLCALQPCAK